MAYIYKGWRVPRWIVLVALAVSPAVPAQGYQVVPWPARQAVPALSAADLNGRVWRLTDLRGKAVLINFWASWCEPCRAEMPSLQALAQQHGPDQLIVLALNFKEPASTAARFMLQASLQLPVILDPQGVMARQWGIHVFPSTVLLAADGRVQAIVRGELDWTGAQAAQLLVPLLTPVLKAPIER